MRRKRPSKPRPVWKMKRMTVMSCSGRLPMPTESRLISALTLIIRPQSSKILKRGQRSRARRTREAIKMLRTLPTSKEPARTWLP